jgi:transcriptional accessory protein Tex/SPT6
MNEPNTAKIAAELGLNDKHVQVVSDLLDLGSTVPFIARYRKEVTGSLDEVAIEPSATVSTSLESWINGANPFLTL